MPEPLAEGLEPTAEDLDIFKKIFLDNSLMYLLPVIYPMAVCTHLFPHLYKQAWHTCSQTPIYSHWLEGWLKRQYTCLASTRP
jgi:hypothetical protein